MTPAEYKEETDRLEKELAALKSLCGGILLETHGPINQEELNYYMRKFNEIQANLKRIK